MATYRTSAAGGGTDLATDRTVTITPAVGDLLVVICSATGNTNDAPVATDDNGGTYTLVQTGSFSASANRASVHIRSALMVNTTPTVITVATGANTAAELVVLAVAGMTRTGLLAFRSASSALRSNQGAGTNVQVTTGVGITTNISFTWCANASNPCNIAAATGWSERHDVGQATPATGLQVATRNSGYTGTLVDNNDNSGSSYANGYVELDGSAAPAGGPVGRGRLSLGMSL